MKAHLRTVIGAAATVLVLAGPVRAGEATDQPFREKLTEMLLDPWVIFGFGAQFMFMMRFVIQWIASERKQRSYVPVVFWYFSLAGGLMLFTYAVKRQDPVFMFGQGLGCFIYIRNLTLIYKRKLAQRRTETDRPKGSSSLVDEMLGDGLAEGVDSAGDADDRRDP